MDELSKMHIEENKNNTNEPNDDPIFVAIIIYYLTIHLHGS